MGAAGPLIDSLQLMSLYLFSLQASVSVWADLALSLFPSDCCGLCPPCFPTAYKASSTRSLCSAQQAPWWAHCPSATQAQELGRFEKLDLEPSLFLHTLHNPIDVAASQVIVFVGGRGQLERCSFPGVSHEEMSGWL